MRFDIKNEEDLWNAVNQHDLSEANQDSGAYEPIEPLTLVFESGTFVSRIKFTREGIEPELCDRFGRSIRTMELQAA